MRRSAVTEPGGGLRGRSNPRKESTRINARHLNGIQSLEPPVELELEAAEYEPEMLAATSSRGRQQKGRG